MAAGQGRRPSVLGIGGGIEAGGSHQQAESLGAGGGVTPALVPSPACPPEAPGLAVAAETEEAPALTAARALLARLARRQRFLARAVLKFWQLLTRR